jgi:hypothetical protein
MSEATAGCWLPITLMFPPRLRFVNSKALLLNEVYCGIVASFLQQRLPFRLDFFAGSL